MQQSLFCAGDESKAGIFGIPAAACSTGICRLAPSVTLEQKMEEESGSMGRKGDAVEKEKKTIRISVRNLVEFLLRSGDLDSRRGRGSDKDAMQAGARMHQKIQKKMGSFYQAEVPLAFEKEYENFILKVEGRADGILEQEDGYLVEEIKGTFRELEDMEEPVPVHLAQAKCYAFMFAFEKKQSFMRILMTYCRLETEEGKRQEPLTKEDLKPEVSNGRIRHFLSTCSMEELELWFDTLLDEYHQWAEFQFQWQKKRDASMQGLEFPFPYRPGQKELVSGVYRTILRKKELFVQAPTGIGKTMSTLFPAVRAIGEGHAEKIFYLTAKTITRTVAQEAFAILREKGLQMKAVTLTAKEKMCVCEEVKCNPSDCPRARGHFDRVNSAVFEMLTEGEDYGREALLTQAEKWQVCPHEMQLDIATWMDAVICDYNYVFDPNVRLKRFFAEGNRGEYVFLIDEAHNLVDRGREMFSAALVKEEFLEMKRVLRAYSEDRQLEKTLERCNRQLLIYKRECDECEILDGISGFSLALFGLMSELERFLETVRQGELADKVLEFYFRVRSFLEISELVDENYRIYTSYLEDGSFQIRLFCVNPAVNLQQCLNRGRSAVFFSATLLPIRYYRTLFSTRTDDYAVYVDSPFPRENRCLMIGSQVSSKYRRRGPEEYRKISEYIYSMVSEKKGNYMVFFPSYRLLEDVSEVFRKNVQGEQMELLLQTPSMNEQQREEFLEAFSAEREHTLIGFCVMGGIFSEGIDLDGEKLIGAAVVGTGIPQVGTERRILQAFYEEQGENGFDYAYRFPGMNKVLQAAGRVIRTTTDRGTILLLDERFLTREYLSMFPREWGDYRICTIGQTKETVRNFWEKNEKKESS